MINLTIDTTRLPDNPVHRGMSMLDQMLRAGIPATGVLFPEGVESGTLSMTAPDLCTGEMLVTWSAE